MTPPFIAPLRLTVPRIIWPAPGVGSLVGAVDFGDYSIGDFTEVDPDNVVTWSLDGTHVLTSTGVALSAEFTGLTPTSYPYSTSVSTTLTGFLPNTWYVLANHTYLAPTGDYFINRVRGVWLTGGRSLPLIHVWMTKTDGAGNLPFGIGFTIKNASPTDRIWIDGTQIWVAPILEFGFPMMGARSWTQPTPGSEKVVYPSGASATWLGEHDALLEGQVIHIPAIDSITAGGPQTGWNGPAGWQAFLRWAQRGYDFAFYPARTVDAFWTTALAEPLPRPQPEPVGQRRLTLRLRSSALERFVFY